jgi:NADPH:quinone reductase-like Zn-dependent oxidoreductase
MKAVICTQYGPPEVLQIREVQKPVPGENELRIKVYATSASSGDCPRRKGSPFISRLFFGWSKPKRNMNILGSEFSGEIESAGKEVKQFKEGDAVFGLTGWNLGANAEYLCLPQNGTITLKPKNLSYKQAAAAPFGGGTALHFLRKAAIQRDQDILIYGASGSVGTSAIQLASYFGANVTGVCSTANLEMVKSLGAHQVIDYTKEDFTKNNQAYSIIFDAIRKCPFPDCKKRLKKNGFYVSVDMLLSALFSKKVISGIASIKANDLLFLKELIEEGYYKPVIDRCYSLEQTAEAHRYVEKGHKKGNVIITVRENV